MSSSPKHFQQWKGTKQRRRCHYCQPCSGGMLHVRSATPTTQCLGHASQSNGSGQTQSHNVVYFGRVERRRNRPSPFGVIVPKTRLHVVVVVVVVVVKLTILEVFAYISKNAHGGAALIPPRSHGVVSTQVDLTIPIPPTINTLPQRVYD